MYKKKVMTLVLCGIVAISNIACGNENTETSLPVQETEQTETTEKPVEKETEQEEITEEEENLATENQDHAETEISAEENDMEEEEDKTPRLTIGSTELEDICAKYDEVLSTYDLESYFGYNIPDGWTSDDFNVDGRQEERYIDQWVNGEEAITIRGFDGGNEYLGSYVTDDDGNEFIPPSDEYEYENHYNDALHDFCKTKEWEEPERPKSPVGWPDGDGPVDFCKNRIYRGNINTPYGKGILCTTVYETVMYTGYDPETHCYTEVDHTDSWRQREEMILEIDEYIVIIEYNSGNWYSPDAEPTDLEYTGRLDEIIPQMF